MSYTDTPTLLQHFLANGSVCTDTRKLVAGDVFFALKGDQFDGNAFAADALAAGAACAVVSDATLVKDDRYLLVEDTLAALQALARAYRQSFNIPILAITGSNGKTTTKELIAGVLAQAHKTHFTQGNFNNHIGVPLTLLAMPSDTEIAVIEMGANHQGEIAALCRIALPTHGLITNVGKAHLEGFGGIEGVKIGKGELYRHLAAHNGVAFVNMEEANLMDMAAHAGVVKKIPYKISDYPQPTLPYYEVQVREISPTITVAFLGDNGLLNVAQSHLSGQHNLQNIMTAIAIGKYFKVPTKGIVAAIEQYIPTNNRSQWLHKDGIAYYMDAYNANPSSMRASVAAFAALPGNRKIAILGDMLELGDDAAREHLAIAQFAQSLAFEQVYLVGQHFEAAARALQLPHFESAAQLLTGTDKSQWKDAQVLVKGSRGIRLEAVI